MMRSQGLKCENLHLRQMIETLEDIRDKFMAILSQCQCPSIKSEDNSDTNELHELLAIYDDMKKSQLYDKSMIIESDIIVANNTHIKVGDTVTRITKKRGRKRKKMVNYSPAKRGRVGRPRKEEWHLFEQEKLAKATFVCTWEGCDKRYYHNSHLVNHMRMHSGERPFICEWPGCGKRYLTNSILISHVKSAHERLTKAMIGDLGKCRTPYKCDLCGEEFRRRDQLDSHSSLMHDSGKPLSCDWPGCDFQTVHSQKLKMHKMRHTGEKPYKCNWPQCDWSFRQQHHLKTHMLKHTGEKPHGCDWPGCERRFQSRQALRIHVERTHKN